MKEARCEQRKHLEWLPEAVIIINSCKDIHYRVKDGVSLAFFFNNDVMAKHEIKTLYISNMSVLENFASLVATT